MAAFNIAKQHDTYFSARYRRLAIRRGKKRAIVAIERALLTAIWHMLTNGDFYQDPDPTTTSNTTPPDEPTAQSKNSPASATTSP